MRIQFAAVAAGVVLTTLWPHPIFASSHREAPTISKFPKADCTDVYMFRSYDTTSPELQTILIANYCPLQDTFAGPMYFFMDETMIYEINLSNDDDPDPEFTFRFQFIVEPRNHVVPVNPNADVEIPLIVHPFGEITQPEDPDLNIVEFYTVTLIDHQQGGLVIPAINTNSPQPNDPRFVKPVDNIGSLTIPDYNAYANQHIFDFTVPGYGDGRVFVGQREDPFVADLGKIFDKLDLQGTNTKTDAIRDKSITSFCIELPTAFITGGTPGTIIGAWATSSIPATMNFPAPVAGQPFIPVVPSNGFQQISRLGNPLVNELVIGLSHKDTFNAVSPADDSLFELNSFYFSSSLTVIMGQSFAVPPADNRSDLVQLFATGFNGLNQGSGFGEMLRLNPDIAPVAPDQQDRMGGLATPPDNAGYPNGRRPGDDVVDIVLSAVAGGFVLPFAQQVSDGVDAEPESYPAVFPFLNPPLPGDQRTLCVTLESTATLQGPFQETSAARHPTKPNAITTSKPADETMFFRVGTDAAVDLRITGIEVTEAGDTIEIELAAPPETAPRIGR